MKYPQKLGLGYQTCFLNITKFLNFLSQLYFANKAFTIRLSNPHKNLHHLHDAWVLTEDCYHSGTQPKFCLFSFCLLLHSFKMLMLESDLFKYFHETYKFLVHFFRESFRLPLFLLLEVVKFFFLAAALNYSICIFCQFRILQKISKTLNDKKVFRYFKLQRNGMLSNQKYSSAIA